ncbi:Allantoicase [Stereum hirsutum FP-91666 SS1]|uniref:Allantoicase n=1 Tax=Stereum hirsutum (strain FP-91666) TaxID=721885 RepID=UPI000444952B|nr:Allantoicase [Stereum hirsutum FP-91666 SS1]EIM81146.1 Allantoicase [Stereum hirsutum FP-91666 SS1]
MMEYSRVPLDQFSEMFAAATELSSVAIGGKICSVSDDFFAEAYHLLLVEPAPSLKGQFGPKGALFSGWESRRHNPEYDWVIIKLGTTGTVHGFDVDTAHFNGNEAPQVSIDAMFLSDDASPPDAKDSGWHEILPKVDLGPSSRHLFKVPETKGINYVKLNMYPDGGIARFRVYGHVVPIHPASPDELFDAAHVFAGGRVTYTSDQHFGVGSNLILPGRGKDMGDGWETKRSRQPGHKDWTVIRLGTPTSLSHVVIDTAHFKGNFPQSCELHATSSTSEIPPHSPSHVPPPSSNPSSEVSAKTSEEDEWSLVLPRTLLGPHREHSLVLENVEVKKFTHVRLTIFPDGGVKRVRVIGTLGASVNTSPQSSEATQATADPSTSTPAASLHSTNNIGTRRPIPALPLTPEAFAPFGQVIQSYPDPHSIPSPRTTKITPANFGTATKYHKLSLLQSSYPSGTDPEATSGISVYTCMPVVPVRGGDNVGLSGMEVEVTALERHPYTNQAFIPMGGLGDGEEGGKKYLVVVTKNGEDGAPDLKTMRAFVAHGGQGIVYKTAVWHQPMTVLDGTMDLACVETQMGNGDKTDCEIVQLDAKKGEIVTVRIL